jgi:hypothetical protein
MRRLILTSAALALAAGFSGCRTPPPGHARILNSHAPYGAPKAPPFNTRQNIQVPSAPVTERGYVAPYAEAVPGAIAVPAQPGVLVPGQPGGMLVPAQPPMTPPPGTGALDPRDPRNRGAEPRRAPPPERRDGAGLRSEAEPRRDGPSRLDIGELEPNRTAEAKPKSDDRTDDVTKYVPPGD